MRKRVKSALEVSLEKSVALDRDAVVSLSCLLLMAPDFSCKLVSVDSLKRLRELPMNIVELAWCALLAQLICKGAAFSDSEKRTSVSLYRFCLALLLQKEASAPDLLMSLVLIKLGGGCVELEERARLVLPQALKEGGPGLFVPALARCCGLPVPSPGAFAEIFDREIKFGAPKERLASILWAFSTRNKIGLQERLERLSEKCTDEKDAYLLALTLVLTTEKVEKPPLNSVVAVGMWTMCCLCSFEERK
jgi:hypothetical protein